MHDRRSVGTPTVRLAQVDDVERIVALVESAYRGDSSRAGWTTEADLLDGQRTDATAVRETLLSDRSEILAVDGSDGQLLGCCQLDTDDGGTVCHFGLFAVTPTQQGSGVGRWLLDAAEQRARTVLGARTMEMSVIGQRAELIAWYERRGYRRTGETRPFPYGQQRFGLPRRDDLHFVVLRKPLAEPRAGDAPAG